MYQVSLSYVGVHFADEFATFEAAVEFAKSKGFSATIHDLKHGGIAGCWTPLNGTDDWRPRNPQ